MAFDVTMCRMNQMMKKRVRGNEDEQQYLKKKTDLKNFLSV